MKIHRSRWTVTLATRRAPRAWPVALAALLLSSLAGCVGEDRDDCPPPGPAFNVALEFSQPDRITRADSFLRHINSVDVFILDSAGGFLRRERVERAALEVYQGLQLRLDPGRYRVTCWGNNTANTAYEGLATGVTAGGIAYSSLVTGLNGAVGDGDPLYRAPAPAGSRATRATRARMLTGDEPSVDGLLTVNVPATGADTIPVPFSAAYHLVEVRVVGLDYLPDIEIDGLPAGDELLTGLSLLDASLDPRRVTSRKRAAAGTGGSVATFTTFLFDLDDPAVIIRVLDPVTGLETHLPVILADEIDATDPSIDVTIIDITIEVVFNFLNGTVTVNVKEWNTSKVQPI
jgi:hypothetical protein